MITNAEIYDKVNNLLMEAVKMNYDIHKLIAAVLEIKKEDMPTITRGEAKAVLNHTYGLMSSMPASKPEPPYWNIEPENCYFINGMNKEEYYNEYFDSDLVGILPEDCDIDRVTGESIRKLACSILRKTFGFAPTPDKIRIIARDHTPYVNCFEFIIDGFVSTYRVEITKTDIEVIVYGDEELVGDYVENATLYVVAEYPEYDEEEDYTSHVN